jgi:hypothetical protein
MQKTKDRAPQTTQKTGINSGAPEGLAVPAPHLVPIGARSVYSGFHHQ